MYLVQFFLPVYDNQTRPISRSEFDRVFDELTGHFGGVTAFHRSPAAGAWKAPSGSVSYDDVIAYEVMVEHLDRAWWAQYRQEIERRFRQEKLLIRAIEVHEL